MCPETPRTQSDGLQTPDAEASRPPRRAAWRYLLFLLVVVLVAGYVNFRTSKIPGDDAYYHMRHASVYASLGPFFNDFPWVVYSVVGKFAADTWYGFHLLLVPFAYVADPLMQIKLASVFLLTVLLLLIWWALRRLGVARPCLWPFVVLFVAPDALYRLLLMRPHMLSTGLLLLLLSLLTCGGALTVGLTCLALTFFHLNLFWLIPVIVGVWAAAARLAGGNLQPAKVGAALAGGVVGWLLRPNPIGAAKILYVQLFTLTQVKLAGMPLAFGRELEPLAPIRLALNFTFLLLLWAGAVCVYVACLHVRRDKLDRRLLTFMWSSLAMSLLFFVMTNLISRRTADLWNAFAIAFVAGVYTCAFAGQPKGDSLWPRPRTRKAFAVAGVALLVLMACFTLLLNSRVMDQEPPAFRLGLAGAWLRDNAREGAIVFNVHWDDFPQLFYLAPYSRYIGGMDPIFQYAFSHDLYWKAHHLAGGKDAASTCGAPQCSTQQLEDTYTVLRRDFHASYIVFDKTLDAGLYDYVSTDKRFAIRIEVPRLVLAELVGPD